MKKNIDKQYKTLLNKILKKGRLKGDRTGTGTKSIFSHNIKANLQDGFPLLTTKKMYTRGIIIELLWFLNGDTNIQYLLKNNVHIWTGDAYKNYTKNQVGDTILTKDEFTEKIINDDDFAKEWGELGPIYGKQWRNNGGVDQISEIIDSLNNNPDSRRILVNAWNVSEIKDAVLPPCHWAFELYSEEMTLDERLEYMENNNIRTSFINSISNVDDLIAKLDEIDIPTRYLSLKWHQRSVDVGLGLPFNIASYAFLLTMISQQVNMVPYVLEGDLTNVHIYKNHLKPLKGQTKNKTMGSPKLFLKKADDIFSYSLEDFNIIKYKSHPKLSLELSN